MLWANTGSFVAAMPPSPVVMIFPEWKSMSTKSTSALQKRSQLPGATNLIWKGVEQIVGPQSQGQAGDMKSNSGDVHLHAIGRTHLIHSRLLEGCHGICGPCVRRGLRSTSTTAAMSASPISRGVSPVSLEAMALGAIGCLPPRRAEWL